MKVYKLHQCFSTKLIPITEAYSNLDNIDKCSDFPRIMHEIFLIVIALISGFMIKNMANWRLKDCRTDTDH